MESLTVFGGAPRPVHASFALDGDGLSRTDGFTKLTSWINTSENFFSLIGHHLVIPHLYSVLHHSDTGVGHVLLGNGAIKDLSQKDT